jgi:K+-transporting ATPase KdpF subunit
MVVRHHLISRITHYLFTASFMGTIIVGLIATALLVYLFVAMIWPERF